MSSCVQCWGKDELCDSAEISYLVSISGLYVTRISCCCRRTCSLLHIAVVVKQLTCSYLVVFCKKGLKLWQGAVVDLVLNILSCGTSTLIRLWCLVIVAVGDPHVVRDVDTFRFDPVSFWWNHTDQNVDGVIFGPTFECILMIFPQPLVQLLFLGNYISQGLSGFGSITCRKWCRDRRRMWLVGGWERSRLWSAV